MRLFIAEKPDLAKAIVEGLGGGSRKDGYYDCGGDYVAWCYGHMLQLLDPEDYDERYSKWNMDDLPMSHIPWKKKPSGDKGAKDQLKVILGLLKKASSVVNAGDPDDEGQLLVDEILEYAGCTLPVKRVLINDNNTKVVRKALESMRDNREFAGLSAAAEARSVGDQLYGYNMTLAAMQAHGVTNAGFPPVYLRQLADWARDSGQCPPVALYSFGGEAMPREGFEAVRDHLKPQRLINGYGPTEAVVTPMLWKVDAQASFSEGYAPIGQPVAGRKAYVLDAGMNRVPRHVAGELYLGGTGLARGYLARAGLSAERFVADPFDTQAGQGGGRLYRTGDWVRWREDGQLEYLGRIDHQVKVRGFRIELGEIEAQLLAQPDVRQAVVVARQGPDGASGASLVAYVAFDAERSVDAELLRERLGRSLPGYMVPRAIVALPALPLNANGKVDRKALPEPGALMRTRAYEAPHEPAARALAALWAEVLRMDADEVGLRDNFFDLGGDSILSLRLLARIRQVLPGGERLVLTDLIQASDLHELASRLRKRLGAAHDAVCLHAEGKGTPLFCLPGLIVNTREFRTLADALRGDRPVYGFVSHVYTARRWRGFAVRELAAEYADYIVSTATEGRCALLGWSLGGDLAFEVAQQLQGRIEIVFCGMVDVFEIAPMRASRELSDTERARADEALDGWLARSEMAAQWRELIGRMDAHERAWVAQQLLDPLQSFPLDGIGDEAKEYLLWTTLDSRVQQARYTCPRSALPVHVFQAGRSLGGTGTLRHWPDHARVVVVDVVQDADHLGIIHHPQLCGKVKAHMRAADAVR